MTYYKKQAVLNYHQILSTQIRSIEKNALIFITTVIAAFGTIVAHKYIHAIDIDIIYLYSAIELFIFISLLYLTSISYTYRQLVIVMNRLEKELSLDQFTPKWDFRKKKLWSFYPENLRMQVIGLQLLSILVILISGNYTFKSNSSYLFLQIFIYALILMIVIDKYNDKLLKRKEEINSNKNNLKIIVV